MLLRRGQIRRLGICAGKRLCRLDPFAEVAGADTRHSRQHLGINRRIVIDAVHQLVPPDIDLVAIPEEMLADRVTVHQCAVGAVEVLEERIGEDSDNDRVLAAHRQVGKADVVVRSASDRGALPG